MIVPSSYDYDTQTIGPYTLPVHIDYAQEYCNGDRFYKYKYYQALLQDENALAVFNVNNYCSFFPTLVSKRRLVLRKISTLFFQT